MYNEYYKIPNYKNKYGTEDLLVIGRSKIDGAGLGLFAFVPLEIRNLPENKSNWKKKNFDVAFIDLKLTTGLPNASSLGFV